jgi:hypothetical protein
LLLEQVACVSQTIQGVLRGVPRHLRGISRHDIATLILRRRLDAIRADGGFGGRASRVSWYCEKAPSKRPSVKSRAVAPRRRFIQKSAPVPTAAIDPSSRHPVGPGARGIDG